MFNYNDFKIEMEHRGHKVNKKGKYITIIPNNNYIEYGKGFRYGTDVVEGFEEYLKLVWMDHFNSWIYSIRFKIIESR